MTTRKTTRKPACSPSPLVKAAKAIPASRHPARKAGKAVHDTAVSAYNTASEVLATTRCYVGNFVAGLIHG